MAENEVHEALTRIGRGTAADTLESQALEFKTVAPVAEQAYADIAEAAACLANAVGDTIVTGVRDTPGGQDAFIGCPLDPSTLRQRAHELTEPHLTVDVSTVVHDGVSLLVVSVPEGLEVYSTSEGVTVRRIEDRCRPMRPDEADAVERWGTPLLVAYDESTAAIRARQRITPVTLASGVQMQVQDFPTVVVREALVNALVHGDHRYREPVRIEHSSDSFKVTSPGPLVSGSPPRRS